MSDLITTYTTVNKTQTLEAFAGNQPANAISSEDARNALGSLFDKFEDVFNTTRRGVVPISSGSANEFLSADATFKIISYTQLSNRPNLSTVATSGSYNDLSNRPNLATVATSGSYNDLSNRPAISSKNEAEAGVNNTTLMTPLRVKEAFDVFLPANLPYIQRPEGEFPKNSEVVSINPTRLKATPFSPIFRARGAVVGDCLNAVYQIATDTAFSNIVHTITKTSSPFDEVFYNIGILNRNTTYYWRMRYTDTKGNVSPWSQAQTFITSASYLFDMLAFEHQNASGTPFPDNRLLTIYDVDVATYTIQNIINESDKINDGGTLFSLQWHPSGRYLACGGSSNAIGGSSPLVIYDYNNAIPTRITIPNWLTSKLNSYIFVIKFSKSGNRIFIGGSFSQRAICAEFNLETGIGNEIVLPSLPGSTIYGADFSFDNNYLVFTTDNASASPSNSYIHVYSWVNSIGEQLTSPIRLSNPSGQLSVGHFSVCFHPRYNQFYVGLNIGSFDQTRTRRINTDNSITDMGVLSGLPAGSCYGLTTDPQGTRLFVHSTQNNNVLMYDCDKNINNIPTFITAIVGIASENAYTDKLSVDPTGNYLAVAPRSFSLGKKPRIYDISTDTFVDITNTVPFADFTDSGTSTTNAVAYRFGKWGYPAEV